MGEGVKLLKDRHTWLGGRLPVNPSGGLLSRGHPVGTTGVAQLVELVEQLRGQAGSRQIEGAKVGLAHCIGGRLARRYQIDNHKYSDNLRAAITENWQVGQIKSKLSCCHYKFFAGIKLHDVETIPRKEKIEEGSVYAIY